MNKKTLPILALISCFLWASAFPVLKITYELLNMNSNDIYSKVQLAGYRFLLAAIIIFVIYMIIYKKLPKFSLKDFKLYLLLGLFQTTLQYFFFYNGLANTSGVKAAVLSSSGTFFVVILAHIVYTDDKITFNKIIGLLSGFIGIIVINMDNIGSTSDFFNISLMGEGFLICAGLVSAIGTILAKNIMKGRNPFIVTGGQMLMGSIILLIVGLIGNGGQVIEFNSKAFSLYVYSAFLSAIAFCIWYYLLRKFKATEVTIYKFLIPILGAILSVLFIREETFNKYIIVGLLFASGGIYIVNKINSNYKNN
ncbi:MAG: DMT family transporter [Vallitalea sp.]|jgi:drug/metabolite transporter (DMT)-like permease|nr:DMT family transporter [Vallitalea sp.]